MTEDEMVGWHHRLNGREFEQTPGDDGQGRLECCNPWGCKESDTTEQLNHNKRNFQCQIHRSVSHHMSTFKVKDTSLQL